MKIALARRSSGFRPKMSDDRPQNGMLVALARRKDDPTQAKPDGEACRSAAMVGRAVVRITVSRAARKTAVQSASIIRVVWRVVRVGGGDGGGVVDGVWERVVDDVLEHCGEEVVGVLDEGLERRGGSKGFELDISWLMEKSIS